MGAMNRAVRCGRFLGGLNQSVLTEFKPLKINVLGSRLRGDDEPKAAIQTIPREGPADGC